MNQQRNSSFTRSTMAVVLLLASVLIMISGCSSNQKIHVQGDPDHVKIEYPEKDVSKDNIIKALKGHIMGINSSGEYQNISSEITALKTRDQISTLEKKIAALSNNGYSQPNTVAELVKEIIQQWQVCENNKPEEIVFIIHGGMVSFSTGLEEALTIYQEMSEDKKEYSGKEIHKDNKLLCQRYPIFINWRSGGPEAYWEQLTKIREGERQAPLAAASAPIKVVSDLGRGLFDMPSFAILEGYRLWETLRNSSNECPDKENITCPDNPAFDTLDEISEYFNYFIKTPFRFVSAPFIHGMGRSAWENMLRRTRNTIITEPRPVQEGSVSDSPGVPDPGALTLLMQGLFMERSQEPDGVSTLKCKKEIPISFIAHSMGTIIATDLLGRYSDCQYNKVLYMAAAVSIREFSEKVVPVLKSQKTMKFYNDSLYPKLEAREMSAFGLVPSGSLLEWIDEMFTPPVTKFDRTLGNWTNVRDVYHHFPKVLSKRMHFRVFGTKAGMPRKHGDFNDITTCFWQDSYLKTYRESWITEKSWEAHYEACKSRLKDHGLFPGP